MTISALYELFEKHSSISTDSRSVQPGDLFFALSGERFNGNQFAMQALEKGAAYAVVNECVADDARLILVDNVLQTLQQLAKYHREQFDIPVIAITGTNGKTTTKELLHAVLSSHYNTYTTVGNLNNHIGIPLTLLRIKKDAQMAIVEMGANHQREIAGYCLYTEPTHGLITNCGKAHLEGFGSLEGVKIAKGELYDYLRANDRTVFVNTQLDYLVKMSEGIRNRVLYNGEDSKIKGQAMKGTATLQVRINENEIIHTQLAGDYNFHNVMTAVAVGDYFNVPLNKIITAIEQYQPQNARSQWMDWNGNKVLLDAYNANPSSMRAAIDNFASLDVGEKILALGAMKEMGKDSDAEHEALIQHISQFRWKEVLFVGEEFKNVPSTFHHFKTSAEAHLWLKAQSLHNTNILVKGSRGSQMEKILGN